MDFKTKDLYSDLMERALDVLEAWENAQDRELELGMMALREQIDKIGRCEDQRKAFWDLHKRLMRTRFRMNKAPTEVPNE